MTLTQKGKKFTGILIDSKTVNSILGAINNNLLAGVVKRNNEDVFTFIGTLKENKMSGTYGR